MVHTQFIVVNPTDYLCKTTIYSIESHKSSGEDRMYAEIEKLKMTICVKDLKN